MKKCQVFGLASKKLVAELSVQAGFKGSLMNFLMQNQIPIASSCNGAGSCKKCVVNSTILSCQVSLEDFTRDRETAVVEVSYL